MSEPRRLLALATYPRTAAATRFRVCEVLPHLRSHGWETRFESFLDDAFFRGFYDDGGALRKARYLAARSIASLSTVLRTDAIDAVFIQREAALVGPPYLEFILRSLKGVPVIFDFDDAIWELGSSRSKHPIVSRVLKNPEKCWYTMRRAAGVIAGSRYLAERAHEVCANVTVAPTVVSSRAWTPLPGRLDGSLHRDGPPRIGWIGTHTTADQLELVAPALHRLRAEGYEFELHIVGAGDDFELGDIGFHRRPWQLEHEIEEFRRIDIGLAPMRSGPVYEGKCGFKQVQYMAVGVPFVSSWVGGARDLVVPGENGLVARDVDDWYRHLKALLSSRELRARLARTGRELVETRYCTEVQGPRIARFIEDAIAGE